MKNITKNRLTIVSYLFPVTASVAAVVTFFYQTFLRNEVIYCCDNLLITIPSRFLLVSSLKNGIFPLWNPYIFSGTPFLADLNLGVLYPFNVIYTFLPLFQALTLSAFLHLLVAVFGMYLFSRSLCISKTSSVLTGFIFGLSGTLIRNTNNLSILQTAAWLPLIFWTFESYIRSGKFRYLLYFIGVALLQIVAGHPQPTFYTWVLLGVYAILSKKHQIIRRMPGLITAIMLLLLLSSVQVLPFLELVSRSTRTGMDFSYATFDSLHPLSIFRLILPSLVGDLRMGTSWAQLGTVNGYIGLIPLILIGVTILQGRYNKFFLYTVVISYCLALGKYNPLYIYIYTFIPGFAWFRSPSQFLLIYTFSAAVLSGFALDQLILGNFLHQLRRIAGVLSTVCFVSAGIVSFGNIILINRLQAFLTQLPFRFAEKLQDFPTETLKGIVLNVNSNVLFAGISLGILYIFSIFSSYKILKYFIIVILYADLFIYSRYNLLTMPVSYITDWMNVGRKLAESTQGINSVNSYRVFVLPDLYPAPRKKEYGIANEYLESAWQWEILRPNLGILYGLSIPDGYGSLVLKSYSDYFNYPGREPTGIVFPDLPDEKIINSGVRVVYARNDGKLLKNAGFLPLFNAGSVSAYTVNKGSNALVSIKSEREITLNSIKLNFKSVNDAIIRTSQNTDSRLTFKENDYPGWEVTVNAKKHNLVHRPPFLTIDIPEGTSLVRFSFRPKSFILGLILSAIGCAVLSVCLTFALINRKY